MPLQRSASATKYTEFFEFQNEDVPIYLIRYILLD
jgi:hypothetical protein